MILRLLFNRQLYVNRFTPYRRPTIYREAPPIIVMISSKGELIVQQLQMDSCIRKPLNKVVTMGTLQSRLNVLSHHVMGLLVIIRPTIGIPLHPHLANSVTTPMMVPVTIFPLNGLPNRGKTQHSQVVPRHGTISNFGNNDFRGRVSLCYLRRVPPFYTSNRRSPGY